jgi:RimJ/RimL family protein N-acetyltransferase
MTPDLFPPDVPNIVLLSAGLEGKSATHIISESDTSGIVRVGADLWWVTAGVTDSFLRNTLIELRRDATVILSMTPGQYQLYDWSWLDQERLIKRYEYHGRNWGVVDQLRKSLPATRKIRRIDAELFDRCAWKGTVSEIVGSPERFLEHSLGVCQMDETRIVAEAYAILASPGAEIGGITHEAYLRQNNATVTCARMMADHLRDVPEVYWSCHQENTASWKTAEKLGFGSRREYYFVVIPSPTSSHR